MPRSWALKGAAAHAAEGATTPVALTIVLTLVKLGAFAVLAIVLGPRIVPWLLTLVARTGSRELFTLTVLAIALGIAFGSAMLFGVSFALGAFFAGVVMSESHLSHRAAADSLPLQNAFSGPVLRLGRHAVQPENPDRAAAGRSCHPGADHAWKIADCRRFRADAALSPVDGADGGGEPCPDRRILLHRRGGLVFPWASCHRRATTLILAGAILSITLNPLIFWAAAKLKTALGGAAPVYGARKIKLLTRDLDIIKARVEEKESKQQLKKQQLVHTFPLFSEVNEHALEELLLLFRPASASPGDKVIRVGERGDAMYFISSGAAEVRLPGNAIRLEAGAFFGEMALLSGGLRTADVIAVDFCHFFKLDRRDFNIFMARHPRLRAAVSDMARERKKMNVPGTVQGGAAG